MISEELKQLIFQGPFDADLEGNQNIGIPFFREMGKVWYID